MDLSVVIPTYNRYTLLKRAIESLLAQTYSVDEIIVVDDGSMDNTHHIQKDFPNIIYMYQKNRGVSAARNVGIKKAKNEWIAFLDSDDEWHKEKLQKQVEFHQDNPEILMSYTAERWIRDGSVMKIPKKYRKIGKDAFVENLSYCNIAPSSVMMHKKLFETVGYFDENLSVCEDYDLWLRVALNSSIALLNEPLMIKYAGHEDQLSFKYWGMDRFRVLSLEKLLKSELDSETKQKVEIELIQKYRLLHKGALKYDKIADIQFYKERLEYLKA